MMTLTDRYRKRKVHRPCTYRLTKVKKKKLLCLYYSGCICVDIACRLGVTDSTVNLFLKAEGLIGNNVRQKQMELETSRAQIKEIYSKHKSCREIAEIMNRNWDSIRANLRAMGLPLQPARRNEKGFKICSKCSKSEEDGGFCKTSGLICNRCAYLRNMKDMEHILKHKLYNKRAIAHSANVKITLTYAQVKSMWEDQEGMCAYTRKPMNFLWGNGYENRGDSMSFDRIDNEGFYEYTNVVLACFDINDQKKEKSISELPEEWQSNLKETLQKRKSKGVSK